MKFLQKSLLSLSVAAATAFVISSQASATPVITQWGYSVDTSWTDASWEDRGAAGIIEANAAASPTTEGVWPGEFGPFSTKILSWGGTGIYHPEGSDRSALTIDPTGNEAGTVFTDGAVAGPTSQITHHNNAISVDFDWLDGATLTTTLTLDPAVPDLGPAFALPALDFSIDFKETANSAPCTVTPGSGGPCPDIFVIDPTTPLSQQFAIGQITYEVSIVTFLGSILDLSDAACSAAGALSGCTGFTTEEGVDTIIQFGFLITQVPEPGTLSLLGLGLVGGAVLRRRKTA